MEQRLYPDLDPFYKFSNIEYGGELEDECVPDYPKLDSADETRLHDSSAKLFPPMNSDETLLRRVPITPTAPPLTDTGGSLLESLYSYIMEELEPPPYSPNDPLSDTDTTWTDDLQPDYDISADDLHPLPEINSTSTRRGSNDINAFSHAENGRGIPPVVNNVNHDHSCVTNRARVINSDKGAKNKDNNNENKNNSNNKQNEMIIVTNRRLEAGDSRLDMRSKINSDYGAWVTWRKNVNRQLATVILLRKGGQVYLQNSDLSRRPLSKTSMEYVIRNARKCNGGSGGHARGGGAQSTSLNGTPYIMYGIPRVALSKNAPNRD